MYPLQITDIPDRPFDKIAIDLVSDLNFCASGNQHILTIIDHLTGWPEAFPIPDKKADTIVNVFINNYQPIHLCSHFILSDNGMEFKKPANGQHSPNNLELTASFLHHTIHNRMENYRFFIKTLNLLLRNFVKRTQTTGSSTLNSGYHEKIYAEIFHCYRWLFIKGNVFIGEW